MANKSFNQELEQFLRTLPSNVQSLLRQQDQMFSPTKGMTNLEAHIYQCEEVAQQFYSSTEDECGDPLDKVIAEEEERIYQHGQNMIGWNVAPRIARSKITRN